MDRNLSDDWLIALNSLRVFRLISICEGHVEVSGRRPSSPHINLRLRPELVRKALTVWDKLSISLHDEFGRAFQPGNTIAEAELRLRVQFGRNEASSRPDMVIKLRATRVRASSDIEKEVADWFTQSIKHCQALDRLVSTYVSTTG
ncbi:MAG TPA: hypothetical protein PLN21_20960 [Gemmatales bacterium]|nr:hypothetical protein [Gemmatales bacterium]